MERRITLYRFDNDEKNEWLEKYNSVITQYENGTLTVTDNTAKLTLHHIIPRSIDATLKNDKRNHIWLPFYEHAMMHYYLWRYDRRYARQLWFIAVYGRKYCLWDFPEGDIEYEKLKNDIKK